MELQPGCTRWAQPDTLQIHRHMLLYTDLSCCSPHMLLQVHACCHSVPCGAYLHAAASHCLPPWCAPVHPSNVTQNVSDLSVHGQLRIAQGLLARLPAALPSEKVPTLLQAIACCLDHPNLCRVLGKIAAPHALVLRLVHGQPLALKPDFSSLLRCRWPPGATFSESYVHQVACGCSAAMQSLTQLGVAHGDLYAHNLLADAEGEAVLCDYGEQADSGSV